MSNLIYHYCDSNALISILENEELWLTGHSFLNDEAEYEDGFELLKYEIDKVIESNPHALRDNHKEALVTILSQINNVLTFSCSFSEEGDLLSQWRSYCPSEGGFAIGFDITKLEKIIVGNSEQHNIRRLEPCVYGEDKRREASVIADGCLKGISLNFDKNPRDIFHNTLLEFMFFNCRSKNDHFSEEKELRLYTCSSADFQVKAVNDERGFPPINYFSSEVISYRTNANVIIPYIKQKFPIEAVKIITLGPSKNKAVSEQGLQMLLRSLGLFEQVTIEHSNIPFRQF